MRKSSFRRLRALRRDERGVAAVEFGIWSVIFFLTMTVALDFGMYINYQLKLGGAVEQASVYAFNTRDNVNMTTIRDYAVAASGLTSPAPVVTVGCNGGTSNCVNAARKCACITGSAPTPTYTETTCGQACPAGGNAGYYLNIKAQYLYSPVLVPNRWLEGNKITETAVVRLQ